jgi:hypothetical protein
VLHACPATCTLFVAHHDNSPQTCKSKSSTNGPHHHCYWPLQSEASCKFMRTASILGARAAKGPSSLCLEGRLQESASHGYHTSRKRYTCHNGQKTPSMRRLNPRNIPCCATRSRSSFGTRSHRRWRRCCGHALTVATTEAPKRRSISTIVCHCSWTDSGRHTSLGQQGIVLL